MNRWRAVSLHLGIGAVVLVTVLGMVGYFWYPGFYFEVQDAGRTLPIVAVVCLVFGPLLTLLVYKPGKKGLRFDLTVIALLQIAALTFGVYRLYVERPYFMVFAMDRFFVLAPRDVDLAAARGAGFLDKEWRGVVLAVASLPEDPEAISRLVQEVLMEGKPDIERRPEFWSHYREGFPAIRSVAPSLQLLRDNMPGLAEAIDRLVDDSGEPVSGLLFAPALGKKAEFAVVFRKADGTIVGAVGLNR